MNDPPGFAATRDALHRVAVHVVARSRYQATGRFSLRVTPGGFGTAELGPGARRVRVAGDHLVVESDASGDASAVARSLDGATLRDLGDLCRIDLDAPLDVGRDTPPLGDVDAALAVDGSAAAQLAEAFGAFGAALDRVLAAVTPERSATLPRLWPEHFDVAVEVDARPGLRVNLGGSPGDEFCDEPYAYVGPWTADRPGEPSFWNAPFGAYAPVSELGSDPVDGARRFLLDGLDRLSSVGSAVR